MRFEGTLSKWNDERGYGFITPQPAGQELFVHISAFPQDGRRPQLHERLTFEVALQREGKKQAVAVQRAAAPSRAGTARQGSAYAAPRSSGHVPKGWALLVVACAVAVGVYWNVRARSQAPVAQEMATERAVQRATPEPAPTVQTPLFRCDGRKYCSQMTSCAEAKFFLKNCPDPRMDGNGDGVPCEQQWCTHPLSP